uniref:Peptide methionine sulfoxide reductase MsrA n=1 Tax=Solibacter usitatus (strain Ellin6076) TaxID=234267 RepID=Q01T83_SOLUE
MKLSMRTGAVALSGAIACFLTLRALTAGEIPPPFADVPAPTTNQLATAVFAGGCFWGVEGVYEHVKGVKAAVSGYAGGPASMAHYDLVSNGDTGHAESVKVTYDPAQISYGKLLQIFFAVAHDPTELNRQGPDWGTQYRSAIFYSSEEEQRVATAYIEQLNAAKAFSKPIVTQVAPLKAFYPAEDYHQHFLERNPTHPYIVYNDLPKIAQLKRRFPELVTKK